MPRLAPQLLALLVAVSAVPVSAESYTQFSDRTKVDGIVGPGHLQANPFQFTDRDIGLLLRFVKMISPTEAIFGGQAAHDEKALIVVSGVPTKAFFGDDDILAAVRVTGIHKEYKLPLATLRTYVLCKLPQCKDIN